MRLGVTWTVLHEHSKLIPVLEVCKSSKTLAKESPCPEFATKEERTVTGMALFFTCIRNSEDESTSVPQYCILLRGRKDIVNAHLLCWLCRECKCIALKNSESCSIKIFRAASGSGGRTTILKPQHLYMDFLSKGLGKILSPKEIAHDKVVLFLRGFDIRLVTDRMEDASPHKRNESKITRLSILRISSPSQTLQFATGRIIRLT